MFAALITRRSATDLLTRHDDPNDNPTVIHDAARTTPSHGHPYDAASLADALDRPYLLRERRQAQSGTNAVWCVMIGGARDGTSLADDEWAAISLRIATAAGFTPTKDRPGARWAALRYPSRMTGLLVASTVGHDGRPVRVDGEAITAACDGVRREIELQDSVLPGPFDRPDSSTLVSIRDHMSGVAHAWGGDDLAGLLLKRAGFRFVQPDAAPGRWRTPYGIDQANRAHLTTEAVAMLRAAHYDVDFDDELFVRPDVEPPAHPMSDPIRDAGELLYFCNTAEEGAALADQVLGQGGVLDRVHEFTHSLTAWADYRLDAGDLAARLNTATDTIFAVMADMLPIPDEVRAHPLDPDTPPEFHTRRATAAKSTTAAFAAATTPTPQAPAPHRLASPSPGITPAR
ncbi:hypothetical protein [Streptomyces sp. SID3343]|uniref:hypothetical protein n=1 Tax=Streptomyces sp. SID3343 TaxID=2690260 RepID=UPI001367C946|nr:hypothetical protein [Streptomyces sp. SID3343]MYV97290.1 hypothetical protein [Streptomyces sp. SID3343]